MPATRACGGRDGMARATMSSATSSARTADSSNTRPRSPRPATITRSAARRTGSGPRDASTIGESPRRTRWPPTPPSAPLLGQADLRDDFRVALALRAHVSRERVRGHRRRDLQALRLEALADGGVLHQLRHFAIEPLDDLRRRAQRRVESEMRPTVDAL